MTHTASVKLKSKTTDPGNQGNALFIWIYKTRLGLFHPVQTSQFGLNRQLGSSESTRAEHLQADVLSDRKDDGDKRKHVRNVRSSAETLGVISSPPEPPHQRTTPQSPTVASHNQTRQRWFVLHQQRQHCCGFVRTLQMKPVNPDFRLILAGLFQILLK